MVSYTDPQVSAAVVAMDRYRGGEKGEVGAARAARRSAHPLRSPGWIARR